MKEIVEAEDCFVELATCGAEALKLFAQNSFDAMLTDIGMPGMSGWELAQEVRKQNKNIPIAVITGWGEAVGSTEQRAAGVDWVIAKPFTTERIAELIAEIRKPQTEAATSMVSTVAA